jgi:hypothetical protein
VIQILVQMFNVFSIFVFARIFCFCFIIFLIIYLLKLRLHMFVNLIKIKSSDQMFTACVCIGDCLLSRWSGLRTIWSYENPALNKCGLKITSTYVNFPIFFCHGVSKKKTCYMAQCVVVSYVSYISIEYSSKNEYREDIKHLNKDLNHKIFFLIMIYFGKKFLWKVGAFW